MSAFDGPSPENEDGISTKTIGFLTQLDVTFKLVQNTAIYSHNSCDASIICNIQGLLARWVEPDTASLVQI